MFWKVVLIILGAVFAVFLIMSAIALIKKPRSVYRDRPELKNPLEGKRVVFIPNKADKENADGVRGHLEAVGDTEFRQSFYGRCVKRVLDVVLSFFALFFLSPLFLGLFIAIVIDDPGPVMFGQRRVGKNKQYFRLHKLRSMKMSTPHDVPTHMLENPKQYITKVGRWLRAHSLDELPQLWDIFIGNMSFVGPRPALWNQDLLVSERDKHNANDVKPGLTGWAQINGRDKVTIPEKAEMDGEYVRRMSFAFDCKCFFGTFHVFRKDDSVVEGKTEQAAKKDPENEPAVRQ